WVVGVAPAVRQLVHDIHAKLVAKIVESRAVRIVARAKSVDIRGFYSREGFSPEVRTGRPAFSAGNVVAAEFPRPDRRTIYPQNGVRDGHFADTDAPGDGLDRFSARVFQFDREVVEVRGLRRPELRLLDDLRDYGVTALDGCVRFAHDAFQLHRDISRVRAR